MLGQLPVNICSLLRILIKLPPPPYTLNFKGFIADYGVDMEACTNGEYKLLGTISEWQPSENEVFVCSISNPIGKRKVVELLLSRGAEFINLIHPTAKIDDYVKYGKGIVLYPNATIGVNAVVGDFVTVSGGISHDCIVEDFVTLSGDATLSGHVSAGECAFFGAKSVVAPDVKIGKNAFVCIGSVVIRNVRDNTKVIGNPARSIDF